MSEHDRGPLSTASRPSLFPPLSPPVEASGESADWERLHALLDSKGRVDPQNAIPTRYLELWRALAEELSRRKDVQVPAGFLRQVMRTIASAATVRTWEDPGSTDGPS